MVKHPTAETEQHLLNETLPKGDISRKNFKYLEQADENENNLSTFIGRSKSSAQEKFVTQNAFLRREKYLESDVTSSS